MIPGENINPDGNMLVGVKSVHGAKYVARHGKSIINNNNNINYTKNSNKNNHNSNNANNDNNNDNGSGSGSDCRTKKSKIPDDISDDDEINNEDGKKFKAFAIFRSF